MNALDLNAIRILCGSLTPETLALVIADFDATDQLNDANQQVADAIRACVLDQLEAMVGEAEARKMISDI
jgi:hypothetical protein